MSRLRTAAAALLLAMGLIHVAATPTIPWPGPRAGMDFAGTGVATILLGLMNLLTAGRPAAGAPPWPLVHIVNTVMAAFLTVFVVVAFEPPVGVAWALTLVVWLTTGLLGWRSSRGGRGRGALEGPTAG